MRPFRHHLLTRSVAEVDRAIQADPAEGARAIEPTFVALKRIAETKLADHKRAASWGEHPDERVPMAMLEGHRQRSILGRSSMERSEPLLQRAVRDDLIWTPLLDEISAQGLWSTYRTGVVSDTERVQRLVPWIEEADEKDLLDVLRFRAQPIHSAVALYTKVFTDPVVERLMERDVTVPELAMNPGAPASLLRRLSTWAVDRLQTVSASRKTVYTGMNRIEPNGLGQVSQRVLEALRSRGDEALEPGIIDRLAAHLKGDVAGLPYSSLHFAEGCLHALALTVETPLILDIVKNGAGSYAKLEDVLLDRAKAEEDGDRYRKAVALHTRRSHVLQNLLRNGLWKDPEVTAKVMEEREIGLLGELIESGAGTDVARDAFRELVRNLTREAGSGGRLTGHRAGHVWSELMRRVTEPDQLIVLYRLREDDNDCVAEIVNHIRADAAVWKEVASNSSRPTVRTALASHMVARQVPEVREILMGSNVADVIACLARDGNPQEVKGLLERLAPRDPMRAFQIMRALDGELLAGIDPSVLSEALVSDQQSVRLEAMQILGSLREAKDLAQESESESIQVQESDGEASRPDRPEPAPEPAVLEDGSLSLFSDPDVGRQR